MQFEHFDTSAMMAVTSRPELVFLQGQGSWLTDQADKRYLDFVQGWAVNCLGHSPAVLVEAIAAQASRLINPSPAFYNAPAVELASLLTAHSVFERVFFGNSGAEANEGAIKLARKWGQIHKNRAFEIITFENGFHGRTLATMSASGKLGWDSLFAPQVAGFPKARYNDIDSVAALIGPNTVAVMLEPIQGEAGVVSASMEFLQSLRELTLKHGLLLIVDEVQTGMGRSGKLFAYEHAGIEPDIMTLGKGIGGGVPLSALLAREDVCCFQPGDQGGTFNGNPLMAAAGLAVLRTLLEPGFLPAVAEKGDYLGHRLEQLSARHGLGGERGAGLLRALMLSDDSGPAIVEAAREHDPVGLLLNAPRPNLLRFMSALNVTFEEIDRMVELLAACLG